MKPYEKIKLIKSEKGISTYELSKLTGIPQSTISKIENGKRKLEVNFIQKIAEALNIPISTFFDNETATKNIEINISKEYTDKYKVTSRDKKQYLAEIKKVNESFFMNNEFNEETKKEILDLMSGLFWEAKIMNKRKK